MNTHLNNAFSKREFFINVTRTNFANWKKYGSYSTFLAYLLSVQTQILSGVQSGLISIACELPRYDKADTVISPAGVTVRPQYQEDAELFIAMYQYNFDLSDFFKPEENERKVNIEVIAPTLLKPQELFRWKDAEHKKLTESLEEFSNLMGSMMIMTDGNADDEDDATLKKIIQKIMSSREGLHTGLPYGRRQSPGDAVSNSIIQGIIGQHLPPPADTEDEARS